MLVVTTEQMRELDRLTIQQYGVPSLTLMERAGAGIAQAILERFSANAKKGVLIVAGKGNNGGDGFVVARLLKKKRIPCEVALLARQDELSTDAAHNLRAFL
ncbi:MAG TPA: NAD(P)H-hydrate epimerase, partial [Candidatus Binatia bacterium]